ncbi:MAG TPA: GDCCVxC domain-containing (seleno)protein [Methyloceanibacter sp.]|nr:GDCCVxC domain-containing (seleno)protein [Methyloceanibacter sp.]
MLTCPLCGHRTTAMPPNACVAFYECPACGNMLKPHQGDCCDPRASGPFGPNAPRRAGRQMDRSL